MAKEFCAPCNVIHGQLVMMLICENENDDDDEEEEDVKSDNLQKATIAWSPPHVILQNWQNLT